MLKLGEVKMPCDEDFAYIKEAIENDEGWTTDYSKSSLKVLVKRNNLSSFQMLKIKAELDVSANLLYCVLQDGDYRPQWDEHMIDGQEICYLSPCSDIGYYSLKSPKPFKNRDFVTQRCWLDYGDGKDKVIYNHSVNHAKWPPKKGFVRGLSYMTAFICRPTSANTCSFLYITQSDPGGVLPAWIVNMASRTFAPKFVKRAHKACLKYDKWKSKHNPEYKPWVNPEMVRAPRIDWNDIIALDVGSLNTSTLDESKINENEVEKETDD